MEPITITTANFQAEVMECEKPVLLDLWAPWCGPCVMLSPTIDEIAQEATDVKVGKINVDENPELAANFGAMSIPLLVVVKDGKVVGDLLGVHPKEVILDILAPYRG